MEQRVITEKHPTSCGKYVGAIKLNSASTLNSLSLEMVQAILSTLKEWKTDDSIVCIVFSGEGEKGFCAGGDIQALYKAATSNDKNEQMQAETFFTHEYEMDYAIHTYPKPVVVLGHGIVMGGGLGIFMGGSHRVVTNSTYAAMPEVKIGLFPDVGGTYFLNRLPEPVGLFLALTAAPLNADDCLYLELANYFSPEDQLGKILPSLVNADWSSSDKSATNIVDDVLAHMHKENREYTYGSNIYQHLELIKKSFEPTNGSNVEDNELDLNTIGENIIAMPEATKWLKKAKENFGYGSAMSKKVIHHQINSGKSLSLKKAFETELCLASNITRHPEFAEGVRALLIDRDQKPAWRYEKVADVPDDLIHNLFTPPWGANPLTNM